MKANFESNEQKQEAGKAPVSAQPPIDSTKPVAPSGQHAPRASSASGHSKKSKSGSKSGDSPGAKRKIMKNAVIQETNATAKAEKLEQHATKITKSKELLLKKQQLKSTKSAPKSGDMPNSKKKSMKSAEGMPNAKKKGVKSADGMLNAKKKSMQSAEGLSTAKKKSMQSAEGLSNAKKKSMQSAEGLSNAKKKSMQSAEGLSNAKKKSMQSAEGLSNAKKKSMQSAEGLSNAKKRSMQSAEGQFATPNITKTMTTNAVIGDKSAEKDGGENKSAEKDGGENIDPEQSGKRRIMRTLGQSAFLQRKCGKGAPRLLAPETIILEKYRIQQMIGGGGFGQIYRAFDEIVLQSKKRIAAVKVVPSDHEPARMVLEQMVLLKLRGHKHIPALYASGCTSTMHFLVMELLGKNLSELRRRESSQRFSLQTVVMCGVQAIDAIKIIHDADFIHRDIKPSNFCIGARAATKRTIYLLDFGMVRQYRRNSGEQRKKREFAGFRGTLRYASFNVHLGKEQTPVDDFISLYYSFVELGEGSLPWKTTKNSNEVKELKLNTSFVDYCKHLPKNFDEFLKYLSTISENNSQINYDDLKQMLRKHLPANFNEAKAPFDWEVIDHSLDAVTTHDSQRA